MKERHGQETTGTHSDDAASQWPNQFDPQVVAWVRQYQEDLEAGRQPDRRAALTLFPEIKEELSACLDALEMVHHALADLTSGDGGQTAADQQEALPPQARLGNFRMLREVGRGGMGVVYEAEDLSLGRRVALKVLPFAAMLDQRQLHRFKNEARTVATLHHNNIVPVFSVGCENGVHYYAMQFVQGRSLAQVLAELRRTEPAGHEEGGESSDLPGSLTSEFVQGQSAPSGGPSAWDGSEDTNGHASDAKEAEATSHAEASAETQVDAQAMIATAAGTHAAAYFRSVANLGAQAADALEHAHYHGVIHRDIKPANLLLDENGHLWVTDFGLARLEGEAGVSLTGDVLGTLRYMSPEQALGKRTAVDSQSDIYSLGATLYELLTLQPLATGRDREQIFRQIAFQQPRALRELNKSTPRDLETIVMKAVEKDSADRYETAQQLGDDLRRFLDDKPIQARRPTLLQKTVKWSRRHRGGVAVAIATAFTVVLAGAVLMWHGQRREAEQRVRAEENLRLALDVMEQLYREFAEALTFDPLSQGPDDQLRITSKEEKYLRKSLEFYEHFTQANLDVPSVRREVIEAYARMGRIQSKFGNHRKAQVALNKAMAIAKELFRQSPLETENRRCLVETHIQQGVAYLLANKLEGAIRELTEAIRLEPEGPDASGAYHMRGVVHRTKSDLELAIADFNTAIRLDATSAAAFNVRGMVYVDKGDLDRAVADFKEAIRLAPKVVYPYNNLGYVYQKQGNIDDAVRVFSDAIRIDPGNAITYFNRASAYREAGAFEQAIADYEEIIRIDPQKGNPYNGLGCAYWKKGDLDKAVEAFREAIRRHPEDARPYNNRGQQYSQMGDLEKAIADFNEALRLDPKDAVAYTNRGVAYTKKGNYAHALADLNEAVRRAPDSAHAYGSRGEMYIKQGRFDEGNADLAKAVDLKPKRASIYYKQAVALLANGQVDLYQASCARMLQRFAGSQLADDQYGTAWTCALAPHAVADLPAAVALANKVVRTDPESTRNLRTLGALLYRTGRVDEAITRLTEADRLVPTSNPPPESPPIYTWYFLAMAQHGAGQTEQAKQWLAKAVESTDKTLSGIEQGAGSKVPWDRRLTLNLLREEAEQRLANVPDK